MGNWSVRLEQKLKLLGFDAFRRLKINSIMKGTVSTKTRCFISHGDYMEYFLNFLSFSRTFSEQSMLF